MLKNSSYAYGWVAIFFHWTAAVVIFGMFGLGLYMVDLTYYDDWYRTAPYIHKSIGILFTIFIVLRLIWKLANTAVAPLPTHKSWEIKLSHVVHWVLYLLILVTVVSGFFISTADGRSIDVFGWFEVPALIEGVDNLEDVAGEVHEIATWLIIGLAGLHMIGAIKHHVIDKDVTLKRMLRS
jgi:cytochrome b561